MLRRHQRMLPAPGRALLIAYWLIGFAAAAQAQVTDAGAGPAAAPPDTKPTWSFNLTAATYLFPGDENYVQPTVTADRGGLHLETRYNYEGRKSVSGFVGWNFEYGENVTVRLTPMFGGVVGDTSGIIPALEFDLAWRWLELYSEGEYVIDVGDSSNGFLYNWSQASVRPVSWLQAGLATQRTRVYQTPRDIQRGPFVGVTVSKITATVYFFNPGSSDHFLIASVGVAF